MTNLTENTGKLVPNLPASDAAKINYIFLSMNPYETGVDRTPINIFSEFPNLETFELHITKIARMDRQTFANASQLKWIYMDSNKITELSAGTFELNQLWVLKLANNEIQSIDDFTFANLSSLVSLYLEYNKLTTISRNTFTGLVDLQRLYLFKNSIHAIEDGAFDLPKLDTLSMFENKLKRLSDNIFVGLKQITLISLDKNGVGSIGNAFHSLNTLETIFLDTNEINDLDFCDLSQLPKLRYLRLVDSIATHQNVKITSQASYFEIKYEEYISRRFPIPNVTSGDVECVFPKLGSLVL